MEEEDDDEEEDEDEDEEEDEDEDEEEDEDEDESETYYIGGPDICRDIMRVTSLYGKEKRKDLKWTPRFNTYHIDLIMDVITFLIMPSSVLVFPPSKYIPKLHHLQNYLFYRGNDLIELSLANCYGDDFDECYYDDLLEVIGGMCSSKLKRLTLPVLNCYGCCGRITRRGVNAITTSKFAPTLQELDLSSLIFLNWDNFLDLLYHLPNLRKLNISNVTTLYNSHDRRQILPIPLNEYSLCHLEHLSMCSFNGGHCPQTTGDHQISRMLEQEWMVFFQRYSQLKTLQVANTFSTLNVEFLRIFKDCLQKKEKPLAFLRIRAYSDTWFNSVVDVNISSRYPALNIIRQMNADQISAGETFDELYQELRRSDVDKFTRIPKIHHFEVIRMFGSIMKGERDDDILSAIDLLIPKYKHIREVFDECCYAISIMVEERKLSPSIIEAFIILATGPENEDFCLARLAHLPAKI